MKPMIVDPGVITRFMASVEIGQRPNDCWKWLKYKKKGYGIFSLQGRPECAHQVSFRIFVGSIDGGVEIRHTCKSKCPNPQHLAIGTHAENQNDMRRDGTTNTKFSDEVVQYIRSSNKSCRKLAEELNSSKSTIHNIKHGTTCQHMGI
jgi:hypothetical protein